MSKGADVLQILVAQERDGLYSGSTWMGDLVRKLGWATDGRSVRPVLSKLAGARLVERDDQPGRRDTYWRPTARGREVDAILDRVVAARGGSFRPLRQAGITLDETLVL